MRVKVIKHFGILGMKWGQRRAQKKSEKWKNTISSEKAYFKAYNKAADAMNSREISRINNMPKYKGKNFNDPKNKKLYDDYLDEHARTFYKHLNQSLKDIYGPDPLGKLEAKYEPVPGVGITFDFVEVKHSEGASVRFIGKVDANGHIVSFVVDEDDELMHYGILGMKWGRRKSESTNSSDDHKTASALRKKSLDEMSNDELKKLNARLQLERQFNDLTKTEVSAGRKFVNDVLLETGKHYAKNILIKGVDLGTSNVAKMISIMKETEKVKPQSSGTTSKVTSPFTY